MIGLLCASSALAQTPLLAPAPTQPQPASKQDLQSLLATIEDDKARADFAAKLRAMIAAQKQAEAEDQGFGTRLISSLSRRLEDVSGEAMEAAAVSVTVSDLVRWAERQVSDPTIRARWIDFFWKIAVTLVAGFLAAWATRAALRRSMRGLEERAPPDTIGKLGFLAAHTFLDFLPLAAFAAASYGVLGFLEPRHTTRVVALMLISAYVAVGAVLVLGRAVLSPYAPQLRMNRLRDESATYAYIWLARITAFAVYGHMAADAALVLGLDRAGYGLALKLLGLVIVAMLVILVLQNRTNIAAAIRGKENGSFASVRNRLADVWHVLAIVYIAAAYLVWALAIEGGFLYLARASLLTALILVAARFIDGGVRRLVDRGFAISRELKDRFPNLELRANRYLIVLQRSLRAFVYFVALLVLLRVWGLHSFAWAETAAGRRAIAAAVTVVVVIAVSVLVWELTVALIERSLAYDGRSGVRSGVRARTLLPLLRTTVKVTLIVVAALVVLSTIGIDITPLLAGAGVVGLAIGFGSQTLVKDVITGWFILMEDQIAVGDVVKLGEYGGLVEAITVRTIRLRDFNGTVNIVPFSEAKVVQNLTKEFSYYVFDVGMTYEEDLGRVCAALKEIGDGMMQDTNFRDLIMAPLEIYGIDKFDASQVIVKARIKTLPIRQWDVGREFNNRMKQRFDELGIEFPYPTRRTIQISADQLKGGALRARGDDEDGVAPARTSQPAPRSSDATPPSSEPPVNTGGGGKGR